MSNVTGGSSVEEAAGENADGSAAGRTVFHVHQTSPAAMNKRATAAHVSQENEEADSGCR